MPKEQHTLMIWRTLPIVPKSFNLLSTIGMNSVKANETKYA